ncbi:hypothetical protein DMENIID0001_004570 [Sergentomyia squamirostris]
MDSTAVGNTGKDTLNERNVVEEEEEPLSPEEERKRDRETSIALLTLFFFSVLMFTLPFGAFYGMRDLLENHFHIEGFENICWSVLSAVITVNVIIILFVYVAYKDNKKEFLQVTAEDTTKTFREDKKVK